MSNLDTKIAAVIYVRVSSSKQIKEGDGLESQLTICREFALKNNLDVEKEFRDIASGRLDQRKGMSSLLSYLKRSKGHTKAVIIDDVSRLARGMKAYLRIKEEIESAGGKLVSPRLRFGESADEILFEMMQAVFSQHFSQKNAETNKSRTRGRMLNGYYSFSRLPVGYLYVRSDNRGRKKVVRDEPVASILSELLSGFAAGRFETVGEAKSFLENDPTFMRYIGKSRLTYSYVSAILRRPIYAGRYSNLKWNIPLTTGKHSPLISYEEHHKILKRLDGKVVARVRQDVSEDFPLRGFVLCEACGNFMTANWSGGRSKHYPYYICRKHGCGRAGKSIRREQIEGEFESLLRQIQPEPGFVKVFSQMLRDAWELRRLKDRQSRRERKKRISQINSEIEKTTDRYVDTELEVVSSALERKLEKLHNEKAHEEHKLREFDLNSPDFSDAFEPAMRILSRPFDIWKKSTLEWRKAMLRMIFAAPAVYSHKQGFRTVNLTLPFRALEDLKASESGLVPPHGLEPRTY
ncbi:recombinase family protein [Ruegeria arenilitoris]|uniref:recombinase family protein n=1 Tax=Ruegeria arenilitoris TaxID=1173585 RepID=UPI0034645346